MPVGFSFKVITGFFGTCWFVNSVQDSGKNAKRARLPLRKRH